MHRLLRPGGRVGVSDVVTEDDLTDAERAERGSHVGCVAGALSVSEYRGGLEAASFADVAIAARLRRCLQLVSDQLACGGRTRAHNGQPH